MTPIELKAIGPWFRDGERYLNGTPIDWTPISYDTMFWMKVLRELLDAPIKLIRGAHPNRPSAVDATCSSVPLAQVYTALTRLQRVSWGIYSGNTFHLDTREFEYCPARWLAVHDHEEGILKQFGLGELETNRKDGWIYLNYHHPKALDAVNLVCRLAERPRTGTTTV